MHPKKNEVTIIARRRPAASMNDIGVEDNKGPGRTAQAFASVSATQELGDPWLGDRSPKVSTSSPAKWLGTPFQLDPATCFIVQHCYHAAIAVVHVV